MRLWTYLLLCLAGPTLLAQNPAWKFEKTLDSLLATKDPGVNNPGFAVCIVDHGQVVYERQFGLANREKHLPIGPETRFNIGSVTKQFTATAILLLEEQGKLRRSDLVHQYVPDLPDLGYPITLDHLISHTSGMHSHLEALAMRGNVPEKAVRDGAAVDFLQKTPVLAAPPGANFAYNNTAYMLLNLVVERVSGQKMADFLRQNIFAPLEMHSAIFAASEADGLPDDTRSYEYQPNKKRFKKGENYPNALGATGVHCTLRDLARWQMNFDHNRLGKGGPALIRQMTTTYALRDGTPVHYGAGLVLKSYRGLPTVEHGGGWNSFLLQCRRFPAQEISVLVVSNNDKSSPFPLTDAICDHLLRFPTPPPVTASNLSALPIPAEQLTGTYLSFNNRIRHLRLHGDTLQITFDEAPQKAPVYLRFEPSGSSDTVLAFVDRATGFPVQFALGRDHTVRGFFWEGGDYFQWRCFFEKLPVTSAPLSAWTGKYHGRAFQQNLRVRRKGEALQLKPVFFLSYPLEQVAGPVFKVRGDRVVLRFTEHGLVLGNDWVSNLPFERK